jgi:hypothetical protein
MEMTGNVFENVVSVGDTYSRAFDGLPGDGQISATGYPNQPGWPSPFSGNNAFAFIGGYRGGGFGDKPPHAYMVSDRSNSYNLAASIADASPESGGRGGRTAP